MKNTSTILLLIALHFCFSSCAQNKGGEPKEELADTSINQKDTNGVPIGLWERKDFKGDMRERTFYTPNYDSENGEVRLHAEIELFDERGNFDMKFTNPNLYNQETKIIVGDFRSYLADNKIGIKGQFTDDGYATGEWKYYDYTGEKLIASALIENDAEYLTIQYTIWIDDFGDKNPTKAQFKIPLKTIIDEIYTLIAIEPHLNTHAYNVINQLEEAYSAFKIEK